MKKNHEILVEESRKKALAAVTLVEASLEHVQPYDAQRQYTPRELEPYDALSDRFVRSVELCLKFFRSYEYFLFAVESDTYRDLLLRMEKQRMISSVGLWIDMRDVRNRMVHEYVPDQIQKLYSLLMGAFKDELLLVKANIEALKIQS